MKFLIAFLLMVFCGALFAQESSGVSPVLEGVLALLTPYLHSLIEKAPWLKPVFSVMLYCRIVIKPLVVAATKIGGDLKEGPVRKFLLSISDHVAYKIVAFLLDWVASYKLPVKEVK